MKPPRPPRRALRPRLPNRIRAISRLRSRPSSRSNLLVVTKKKGPVLAGPFPEGLGSQTVLRHGYIMTAQEQAVDVGSL
jgi:hypothetical protein